MNKSDGGVFMATCISKEISCPGCTAVNKRQMWIEIERSADPQLREQILEETLFDWQCPDCGYQARMVYPCLYHEKQGKWMVYLSPSGRTQQVIDAERQYPGLSDVKKRLVLTPAQLKEKVMIFERGLNDVALEMVKLALQELTERKQQARVERMYFLTDSEELDYLGFSMFLQGEEKPVYQGVRLEVYEKSLQAAHRVDFTETGFQQVDLAMAKTLLEQ